MGTTKTKVRIFSIWLTSFIVMTGVGFLIRSGLVQDYNTIQLLFFITFTSGLVFIFAIFSGLVMLVEGLLLKWGNKLYEAQKEDEK